MGAYHAGPVLIVDNLCKNWGKKVGGGGTGHVIGEIGGPAHIR